MPPVVVAIVAGAAAYGAVAGAVIAGITITTGAALAFGAVVAVATYQSAQGASGSAPSSVGASVSSSQAAGIKLNGASNTEPILVPYGRREVAGTPVLRHVTGDQNKRLHMLHILGEGPIESVGTVFFNDKAVSTGEGIQQQVVFKFNGLIDRYVTVEFKVVGSKDVGGTYTDNINNIDARYRRDGGYFRSIKQEKDGWLKANITFDPYSGDLYPGDTLQVRITERSGGSRVQIMQFPSVSNGWILRVKLHDHTPHIPSINKFEFTVTRNNTVVDRSYSTASEVWPILGNQGLGNSLSAADEAVFARMRKDLPGVWDTNKNIPKLAALYIVLDYDPEVYDGLPIISADIRGRKIYDPRSNTTQWSDNPVLCLRDYFVNPLYGRGIPAQDIDNNALIAAANFCDERLPENGQKRYTCNGVVNIDNDHMTNMGQLLTSFRGMAAWVDGKWKFIIDRDDIPVAFEFNADNMLATSDVVMPSKKTLFNEIEARFFNPAENWQDDIEIVHSDELLKLDNGNILKQSISLPFTSERWRVNNIATINVNQSRHSISARFTATIAAQGVTVGDIVPVQQLDYGWDTKLFRVVKIDMLESGDITVSVREHEPAAYDYGTINPDPSHPDTNLPDYRHLPAPDFIKLESGTEHLLIQSDGTITTRLYVVFGAVPFAYDYEVQYKDSFNGTWISVITQDNEVHIHGVVDGDIYDVRVRGIAGSGHKGRWKEEILHHVGGKTAPPETPKNFNVQINPAKGLELSFDANTDLDIDQYILYYGETFANAVEIRRSKSTTHLWKTARAGKQTLWCVAVDTTGNKSKPVSKTITITSPQQPIATVGFEDRYVLLDWPVVASDFNIDYHIVKYDGIEIKPIKDTRYRPLVDWLGARSFQIIAVDIAGNRSEPGIAEVNPVLPSKVVLRSDVYDNNVALTFKSTSGSLPIDHFEIRKGDSYSSSEFYGTVTGRNTLEKISEPVSGTFTYWMAAVDSAGNHGLQTSNTAIVDQPKDYDIFARYYETDSKWDGTIKNGLVTYDNTLVVPVRTGQSWKEHFKSNNWSSPRDQINAGFEYFIQPSSDLSSYEKTFDLGTTLKNTLVKVILTSNVADGNVSISNVISWSGDGITYTDGELNRRQVKPPSFRYIKIRFDFAASGGDDLLEIFNIETLLDRKEQQETYKGYAKKDDVGGTVVRFVKDFIDVDLIQGSSFNPDIAVVIDFVDIDYPKFYKVILLNKVTGKRVSGDFSVLIAGLR